ncbi:MAG TPA: T9SS type A sorting domain-containing protein, partial [Chitinophagales bacterium]|nr:T9SS type A sorting domain-containing protein [Chitinophagales bacterium]
SWGNAPISWSVNDVGGDITWDGVNSRTYYRSTTGNALKYFSGSSAYSTGLSNCAGWLAIDQFGKVFYKGTDSKIWNYYYNGSIWTSAIVSNNANVGGSITLDMAGGNVFYRGTDNNIWKVSWNSGTSSWNAAVQVTSGIAATDHLVWGVNSNRLYFRGSDSRIYNYYWTGSSWNTAALSYAAEDANCAGNLAYDNTRDILYYTGNDNRLWYYFNDRGWNTGTGTIYNTLANWNATNVTGPVIVRNDGVVYYRGSDNKLYENFNGDNLSDNPACSPGNYQVFKQGENEEQEEVSTTIIETPENTALLKVYPNPSRDIFNFELYIPDDQEGELFIYNLQSQRINMTEPVQHFNAGKNMITYDASALPAGVYYYSVQLKETVLTGRMIKN